MKKSLLALIKYLLGLGLGGVLLYFAFRGIDFADLKAELSRANLSWLLLAMGVGLVSHYFRAARWRMQMIASGYDPSLLNTFAAVMVAYLVNLALPRAGEVARCSVLLRSDRVPLSTALGTVVVERVFDVIVLGLMVLAVFFLEFDTLYQGLRLFSSNNPASAPDKGLPDWIYVVALGGLLLAGLGWFFRRQILEIPLFHKMFQFARDLIRSAMSIRYLKYPGRFVVYTLIIWICYILMTYIGFFIMPAISGLDINLIYFAWILTVVGGIGFALPSPGGMGSYHAAVVICFLGFQVLPDADASRQLGLAFATILHASQLLMMVVVGGLAYMYLWVQPPRDSTIVPA